MSLRGGISSTVFQRSFDCQPLMDILRARSVARGLGTLFGLIRWNGPLVLVFDQLLLLSLLLLLTARLRITWPSHAMYRDLNVRPSTARHLRRIQTLTAGTSFNRHVRVQSNNTS